MLGTRRVFERDQRSVVDRASIDPDVAIAHQSLCDIEPIRLAINAHDFATVMVGLDHVDEHLPVADEFDQRGASCVSVGLSFLRRVDVLQTYIDIPTFRRPDEKTIAVENSAYRAREVLFIGVYRRGNICCFSRREEWAFIGMGVRR